MYSVEFRKVALNLYDYFQSMRKTAKVLNVSVASLCRWCKRLHPLQRKQTTNSYVCALSSFVKVYLDNNKVATCVEIAKQIQQSMQVKVSRQLVHNIIKSNGFSYKRTRQRGYNAKKKDHEVAFLAYWKHHLSPHNVVVSIDESGFDTRKTPTYGYAKKGQPCIMQYQTSCTRKRISLLMAVSNSGKQQYQLVEGMVDSNIFFDFIADLTFPRGSILLMDNASIHKSKHVRDLIASKGYVLLFTPPYSPEYNPIENIFGIIKNYFYKLQCLQPYSKAVIDQCIKEKLTYSVIVNTFYHQQKTLLQKFEDYKDEVIKYIKMLYSE